MLRFAACLMLLCASSLASARDVHMAGANGDGGAAPDVTALQMPTASAPAHRPASTSLHGKVKAPTPFRGGDDDQGPHAPRWHSFLPGMFR